MQKTLAVITLGLLACFSCRREAQHRAVSPQRKNVSAQTTKPAFELSLYQQQNLRSHVTGLTLGEMRSSVTAIMGSPNREDLFAPKKALEWRCRILLYFAVKLDMTQYNAKDRQVELVFNREDALIDIISNVDGIASRGDMSECR